MIDIDMLCQQVELASQKRRNNFTLSIDEASELITSIRQSEKDAARYRFMRDGGKFKETGVEFDAAVDKAMEILGGIE